MTPNERARKKKKKEPKIVKNSGEMSENHQGAEALRNFERETTKEERKKMTRIITPLGRWFINYNTEGTTVPILF